jgi:hypothetical protein
MKQSITKLVCLSLLLTPVSGFALEYLWTDEYGSRVFDCGGLVVGGRAAIKDKGQGLYRVKGVLINREVRATSIIHAAQIACGEIEEEIAVEQKPAAKDNEP